MGSFICEALGVYTLGDKGLLDPIYDMRYE